MGCGCKGKKKNLTAQQRLTQGNTNSEQAVENRRKMTANEELFVLYVSKRLPK